MLVADIYRFLNEILVKEVSIKARKVRGDERKQSMDKEIARILNGLPNADELFTLVIAKFNGYDETQPPEWEIEE